MATLFFSSNSFGCCIVGGKQDTRYLKFFNGPSSERINYIKGISDEIEHDLIRGYFEKMKEYEVVLVVNPEKTGVAGYIGGNTLIEMAFGHVLGKKLYVLYPLPDPSHTPPL